MVEHNALIRTAEMLNTQLGIQPLIDTTMSYEDLQYTIAKVSTLVTVEDAFPDDVINVLLEVDGVSEEVATALSVRMTYDAEDAGSTQRATPKPKPTHTKKASKRVPKPHIVRIEQLIAENSHTAKQIADTILSEFDLKRDTVMNYIRCAKNEKYTFFARIAQENEDTGVFSFID